MSISLEAAEVTCRVARLVSATLPISGWPALLRQVVHFWSDQTSSPVWVAAYDGTQLRCGACKPGSDEPCLFSFPLPDGQTSNPDVTNAPDWMASLSFDQCYECASAGSMQGIVRVASARVNLPESTSAARGSTSQDLADLAAVTGGLFAQARAVLADAAEWQRRLTTAKLESLAEFSAGAGHEINNPVATIVGRAQLLLAGETDPERRQSLSTIGGQALRIRDMIGDVMLFARPPEPVLAAVDLARLASETLQKFADDLAQRGCLAALDATAPVVVRADVDQAAILLGALIRNALEVGSSSIAVSVTNANSRPVRGGLVTIVDNGKGLTELEREHLFDPYFSGRQAGRGLGFGLSKAWRIITGHGGEIEVHAATGSTRFEIFFPAETIATEVPREKVQ